MFACTYKITTPNNQDFELHGAGMLSSEEANYNSLSEIENMRGTSPRHQVRK